MEAYIARQPIFNKAKHIYAYELLFRGGIADKTFLSADADQASSRVVMESFFSRGVDSITGGKPAFINFTTRLILENTATLFPNELLVVEILEDVLPTPDVVEACRTLRDSGYKLALDDFVYSPEYDPLLELCSIVKIDFLSNTPQEISHMIKKEPFKGKLLLAEKIETNEVFDVAVKMGFSLFQGYFFSKPVTMSTKVLLPGKLSYISLMREVSREDEMNFHIAADIIRNDVALSYKLLRLVNSAYYGLRCEVTDITRAVAIIGAKEFRKWTFMITLMGLSSDKPDEIVKMSMIRGRFLEEINTKCSLAQNDDSAFLVGLFSMLDVLMDVPIEVSLEDVHLAEEVRDALIKRQGPLYTLLEIVISLERCDWIRTDELAEELCLDTVSIPMAYMDSVKWCNELKLD